MSLTPKQQLEQVNNPNLLSILSTIQGLPSQESLKHGAYVWKKLTSEGGDFVDFVVSNNETAYPDGAVHTDGYWYELFDPTTLIAANIREGVDIWGVIGTMVEGITGIDFGIVTLSSASENVSINHNLGIAPSYAVLVPVDPTVLNGTTFCNINGAAIARGPAGLTWQPNKITINADSITFTACNSSYIFPRISYYWIAIA